MKFRLLFMAYWKFTLADPYRHLMIAERLSGRRSMTFTGGLRHLEGEKGLIPFRQLGQYEF